MADFIPKPDCTRLDGACFDEGQCLSNCDRVAESLVRGSEVRQLREDLAAERAAKEAAIAEREALRAKVEGLADRYDRIAADHQHNADLVGEASSTHRIHLNLAGSYRERAADVRALVGGETK